jgi:hypothetical protein
MEVPSASRDAGATAAATAKTLAVRRKGLVAFSDPDGEVLARKYLGPATVAVAEWDAGSQLLFGLSALERSRPAPGGVPPAFREAFDAFKQPGGPLLSEDERQKDARARWQKLHAALDAIRNVQNNRP